MCDADPILPSIDQCARCIDREIVMTCVVERDLTDPANIAFYLRYGLGEETKTGNGGKVKTQV